MPDESAELQLVRARAVEAEAKVAQLQRLLSQVTGERDAHRDRAEADAHRIEQLRGEAEGLTTDLGVVRHDLARAIDRSGEMAADLGAETDDALALLDLAMTTGLAVADEARAEADRVARHAGELSRQLGAVRDELAALRERPAATPALDEDVLAGLLARVAAQAARQAVRATREDLRLRALAATVPGGIDELERLALGYTNLLRQTGHA